METCKDCMDFDSTNSKCLIRFTVKRNKDATKVLSREGMNRKPNDKACKVFMQKREADK